MPVPCQSLCLLSRHVQRNRQPERLDRKELMPGAKCSLAISTFIVCPEEWEAYLSVWYQRPTGLYCLLFGQWYLGSEFLSIITRPSCSLSLLILLEWIIGMLEKLVRLLLLSWWCWYKPALVPLTRRKWDWTSYAWTISIPHVSDSPAQIFCKASSVPFWPY